MWHIDNLNGIIRKTLTATNHGFMNRILAIFLPVVRSLIKSKVHSSKGGRYSCLMVKLTWYGTMQVAYKDSAFF